MLSPVSFEQIYNYLKNNPGHAVYTPVDAREIQPLLGNNKDTPSAGEFDLKSTAKKIEFAVKIGEERER